MTYLFLEDWFDVLDDENRPVLTEREVIRNLQAIVDDADTTDRTEVCLEVYAGSYIFTLPNRLQEVQLVYSRLRTAKYGPSYERQSRVTELTHRASK